MLKIQIKDLVDAKFENINQFAKAIGIGYQPTEKLYNGDVSRIGLDTLEAICDVLDCTPSDILVKEEKSTKKIGYNNHTTNIPDQPNYVAEGQSIYGVPSGERVGINHESPMLKNISISFNSKNKPMPSDSQLNKLLTEIVSTVVNEEIEKQFTTRFKKYEEILNRSSNKNSKKGGD